MKRNRAPFLILLIFLLSNAERAEAVELLPCATGSGYGVNIVNSFGDLDDGSRQVTFEEVSRVFPLGVPFLNNFGSFFINMNGNLSFGELMGNFTPDAIPGLTIPTIAAWFADVDMTSNVGGVFLCLDDINQQIIVTWDGVGYYPARTDKLNSFQIILKNNDELCPSARNFEVEFRYEQLEWTTGNASNGVNGLGGSPAVAGIDSGDTINAIALPGSGTSAVLQLVNNSNVDDPGLFRFLVAEGTLPSCGNNSTELCEECDDGNTDNLDGCNNLCLVLTCGDGIAAPGFEACDLGAFGSGAEVCPSGSLGAPLCNNDPNNPDGDGSCSLDAPLPDGCVDVDECANGTAACNADATCSNTPGGYECVCPPGYSLSTDGLSCVEIDECATGVDDCDPVALCTNTIGGFTCACPGGYDTLSEGRTCVDIDECTTGAHDCPAPSQCINSPGAFTCECPAGYQDVNGDGRSCVEIDECATGVDDCDPIALCTNTIGGFTCACPGGYDTLSEGRTCVDIDECALGVAGCDPVALCTNLPGAFTCACPAGYQDPDNGRMCIDIDECALGIDDCGVDSTCINLPGDYDCLCPSGYDSTPQDRDCTDIDECALGIDECAEVATCFNAPGSFTCACPGGYTDLDEGRVCEDIDECSRGDDDCDDEHAQCLNTLGAFDCLCDEGYSGDGRVCLLTCGDGDLGDDETCDPAITDPDALGYDARCRADCSYCGDGQLDEDDEACDDGDDASGDGCSDCAVEEGWICTGEPSLCSLEARCGDGILDPGEGCDDGGDVSGDGCASTCSVEFGWICEGVPSLCRSDRDLDGVADLDDNCPDTANPDQADRDLDGLGDACDLDVMSDTHSGADASDTFGGPFVQVEPAFDRVGRVPNDDCGCLVRSRPSSAPRRPLSLLFAGLMALLLWRRRR